MISADKQSNRFCGCRPCAPVYSNRNYIKFRVHLDLKWKSNYRLLSFHFFANFISTRFFRSFRGVCRVLLESNWNRVNRNNIMNSNDDLFVAFSNPVAFNHLNTPTLMNGSNLKRKYDENQSQLYNLSSSTTPIDVPSHRGRELPVAAGGLLITKFLKKSLLNLELEQEVIHQVAKMAIIHQQNLRKRDLFGPMNCTKISYQQCLLMACITRTLRK